MFIDVSYIMGLDSSLIILTLIDQIHLIPLIFHLIYGQLLDRGHVSIFWEDLSITILHLQFGQKLSQDYRLIFING